MSRTPSHQPQGRARSAPAPATARAGRRWLGVSAGLGALAVVTAALVGGAAGVGGYTFYYAEGASYLTNDPAACANCHVMRGHFDAWQKSSHHAVAVCNDCHAPHGSLVAKYYCKGRNGFFHSLAFTTGEFHEPIMITDYNRWVTEDACRHCHDPMTHLIDAGPEPLACIRCHDDVGHPQ